jgi:hypothetical protein
MQAIFEKGGMNPVHQASVEDARNWLKQEMEIWRKDIADAGIKVDE